MFTMPYKFNYLEFNIQSIITDGISLDKLISELQSYKNKYPGNSIEVNKSEYGYDGAFELNIVERSIDYDALEDIYNSLNKNLDNLNRKLDELKEDSPKYLKLRTTCHEIYIDIKDIREKLKNKDDLVNHK